MPRPKHPVVLLHGINSRAENFEAASGVLSPHFHCALPLYEGYAQPGLGALRIILEPLPLFLSLAVILGLTALLGPFGAAMKWGIWGGGTLIAALVALALARRRRSMTVRYVFERVQVLVPDVRPHVIAHSYGTLVTGLALERFPSLQVGRVILSGCVLPRTFGWERVRRQNPFAFRTIRNEIGGADWVVRIAGAFRRLVPQLGDAGVKGFKGPSTLVHTTDNGYGQCSACVEGGNAPIHNVSMAEFKHSDPFVGEAHAKRFWLPILWGIRPDEFQELQDLCRTAVYYERKGDRAALVLLEDEVLDHPWIWAEGSSIGDLVWEQLLRRYPYLGGSADTVLAGHFARAVRLFWHAVDEARLELAKPLEHRRERQLRRLHPWIAVAAAAEVV